MRSIATTEDTNDIYLDGNGNLAILTGAEAIASQCLCACRTLQGEIGSNMNQGVPYMDLLYSQQPKLDLLRLYLMNIVNNSEDVVSIKNFNFELNNNQLQYNIEISTVYGDTIIHG